MVTDERLAEMLAGLEGVPPGPWVPGYYEDGDPDGGPNGEFYPDGSILSVHDDGSYEHVDPWKEVVAKHFARCDPDTMRSILTELQSLRASIAEGVGVNADLLKRLNTGVQHKFWEGADGLRVSAGPDIEKANAVMREAAVALSVKPLGKSDKP